MDTSAELAGRPRQALLQRIFGTDGLNSLIVWLVLVGVLILIRLVVTVFFPNAFNDPSQAAYFAWPAIAVLGVLGVVGVYFAHLSGFPAAWSTEDSLRRWLLPVGIGLAFGVGYIVMDKVTGFVALNNAHHGVAVQFVGYVPSILIFVGGAIISELVFRLVPIPLLLWLISYLALRKRWTEQVFWVLAILTSLLEPVSQFSFLINSAAATGLTVMAAGFAFNMVQAGFFRRYGFLSAIAVRIAFYMIWHVAYVH